MTALWAAWLHGKGTTISAVLSQKKKKTNPKPSAVSQEEGKSNGYGTGWDAMRPDLPAWPFGYSLNLPLLQLIGSSLGIAGLLSLALSSHLSHLFPFLGDKLSLWQCPFTISFYNPPSHDAGCFKKQIRLLVPSSGDEGLPQKAGHLDKLCSDLLAVQWFCGHSRVGFEKEEKSGRQGETVGKERGGCSFSFPSFFGSSFLSLLVQKVHSHLMLGTI